MKTILIICLFLVGCGSVPVKPEIVHHPTNKNLNCFSPDFFKESMVEIQDCMGEISFTGSRAVTPWGEYQCLTDEFLVEIANELQSCVEATNDQKTNEPNESDSIKSAS